MYGGVVAGSTFVDGFEAHVDLSKVNESKKKKPTGG